MADVLMEPVGPSEVALLVALPLDEDAFLADVDWRRNVPLDGRGDFAWSQTAGMSAEEAWVRNGQPLCELLGRLIDTARGAGIPSRFIVTAATLDDIERVASDGAKVICVVAHWRASHISSADLDADSWPSVISALKGADTGVLYRLAQFLSSRAVVNLASRAHLADELDAFVESYGESLEYCEVVREALDARLSGLLAPGNCLELRDGVYKAGVLATALPHTWSGVLDLSVCHSMKLATTLRGGRQDRRVIANTKRKFLDRVVPELRETFARLAHCPSPYVSLRANVAHIYGTQLLEAMR